MDVGCHMDVGWIDDEWMDEKMDKWMETGE